MYKLAGFIVVLVLCLIVVFKLGQSSGYSKSQADGRVDMETLIKEISMDVLAENPPPECHATNCPEYTFFDADGDGLNESVVTEYTTMTQHAGRIWIIDKGKVVFKSDERAQISVEPVRKTGENNGFVIGYNTTYQLSPDFLDSFKSDYYEFRDGGFVLTKTVDH